MASSKSKLSADEKRWRAEDDLRTLERADEVRSDKSRLAAAESHARTQIRRMKKITGSGRGRSRR